MSIDAHSLMNHLLTSFEQNTHPEGGWYIEAALRRLPWNQRFNSLKAFDKLISSYRDKRGVADGNAFLSDVAKRNTLLLLAAYLGNGEQAAYQLSGQLADIFDQYLVYRPDWINSWQSGKLLGLGEGERWQAELWRFLDDGAPNTPHRVALWQNLLAGLGRHPLPERILVFGIATLAPLAAAQGRYPDKPVKL
ncbi:exodeoxyribonuclease V subunit gamma, partial [Uruburuella suis]|uniref:exodeoxyribonuclease V subunit gamma n=1 Tax=Uruburuella suis TaxID=252130 RepID=UPI00249351C8